MLCQDCPKKSEYVELCAEAELYVNQDSGSTKELLLETDDISDECVFDSIWDYQKDEYTPVELKKLIIQLHLDSKNTYEIAYHLRCSRIYIQQIVSKFKTK